MLIFADTEFADFDNPRLISVGLVAEDAYRWIYSEIDADHWYKYASEFVLSDVVPLLHQRFGQEQPAQAAQRIRDWAAKLPEMGQIACDSDYDWDLLRRLMLDNGGWPEQFANTPHRILWTPEMGELLELYFLRYGLDRHHALNDATALRFAYGEAERLEAEAKAARAACPKPL